MIFVGLRVQARHRLAQARAFAFRSTAVHSPGHRTPVAITYVSLLNRIAALCFAAWRVWSEQKRRNHRNSLRYREKKIERAPLKTAGFCVQNAKIALKGAQSPRGLRKNRGFAYAKPRFLR